MKVDGWKLREGLRGLAIAGRDGSYASALREVNGELQGAHVCAQLFDAASRGGEHAVVYKCPQWELDEVNRDLGANFSGKLSWIFTDQAGDIPRILEDRPFGKVFKLCRDMGLDPHVHAAGETTRLVRIEIVVEWSAKALATAAS